MSDILITLAEAGKTRRERVAGVDYLVAPVVAIKAGVLKDELVTFEEISKYPSAWNGRPVVINHPENNGRSVSANDPNILADTQIGYLFGINAVDNSLKGEIWINLLDAERVTRGAEVVGLIEAGKIVEVSTAYFRDRVDESGNFDGKQYTGIAKNIRADHLAILLDEKGACSIADGCGAPRVNQQEGTMAFTDLSYTGRSRRVQDAWREEFVSPDDDSYTEWPREVFEDKVVVETAEGYLAYPYTVADDGRVAFSEPTKVEYTVNQDTPVGNPYSNEHSCRLRNPVDFQEDSFRRKASGKLSLILGKLKGEDTMTNQAFRYPTDDWSEEDARAHCKENNGTFEPATPTDETANNTGLLFNCGEPLAVHFTGSPRNPYGTHASFEYPGGRDAWKLAWRKHLSQVGGGATTGTAMGPLRGTQRRIAMIAAGMKPACTIPTDVKGAREGQKSPLSGSYKEKPSDYNMSRWKSVADEEGVSQEDIRLTCRDLRDLKTIVMQEINRRIKDRESSENRVLSALKVLAAAFGFGVNSTQEVNRMDELIAQIVNDGRLKLSAEDLEGMSEAFLQKLVAALAEMTSTDETPPNNADIPTEEPDTNAEPCAETSKEVEAFVKAFANRGGVEAVLSTYDKLVADENTRKAQLVERVMANAAGFTKEELNKLPAETLATLSRVVAPADYSGMGETHNPITARDEVYELTPLSG